MTAASDAADAELLAEFARTDSETAFAALVERHIGLVHSVALRHTSQPQQAQDITQAVFIILAKKANQLPKQAVLPGWLYHTARLTAANFQRAETSRIRREQEAYMQSTLDETAPDALWREMSPLLDEAMAHLRANDRDALVLRYFQNKTLPEVGAALGLEERAAQKRVTRAVEKLRKIFAKRGVTLTAAAIAGAVSANSVQAAPVVLAKTVTAMAITKGAAASGLILMLVKGTMKMMTWLKFQSAAWLGAAAVLTGTATVAISQSNHEETTNIQGETINLKIERLSRPGTTAADALRVLGEPASYASGTNYFAKAKLPENYLLDYTNGIEVYIQHGLVVELRSLRPGPGFGFHGKLRLGSTLEEVLDVVGPPTNTSSNQPTAKLLNQRLAGDPDVLYTDIGGVAGSCLYWRPDQGVHFLFKNNRVIAMIMDVPRRSSGVPYQMLDDMWQLINGVDKSKLIIYASLHSRREGVRPTDLHFDIPRGTNGFVFVRLGTNGLITDFPHEKTLRRENPMVTVNESDAALTFSVWATMPIPDDLSFRYQKLNDLVVQTSDTIAKAKKTLIRPGYVGYSDYVKWLFSSPWNYRVRGVIFQFPEASAKKATVQILAAKGVNTYNPDAKGQIKLSLDKSLVLENPIVKVSEQPIYIGPDLIK